MVVIGGYNSSNTCNLARICAGRVPTYHIADPDCLVSPTRCATVRSATKRKSTTRGWLPPTGPVTVGLTAGASTPDNLVGAAVAQLGSRSTGRHGDPRQKPSARVKVRSAPATRRNRISTVMQRSGVTLWLLAVGLLAWRTRPWRPPRGSSGGSRSGSSASCRLSPEQTTRIEEIFQAVAPTAPRPEGRARQGGGGVVAPGRRARADEAQAVVAVARVEAARSDLGRTARPHALPDAEVLTPDQHVKLKVLHEQYERDKRRDQGAKPQGPGQYVSHDPYPHPSLVGPLGGARRRPAARTPRPPRPSRRAASTPSSLTPSPVTRMG